MSAAAGAGVVVRPLAGLEEREACVALQERVWGDAFADRVPASVLMIALETGGVASGAFLDGRLVGFVFGITGQRDGRALHWSDMLAVAPEHRGQGIGLQLKAHQRALLLDRGVDRVLWTFDPLEARNAHINLRKLGAVAREYRRDVYGASDSPLHAGIGTDRLLADWPIASERVRRRLDDDVTGHPASSASAATASVGPPPGDDIGEAGRSGAVLNPPVLDGPLPRPGRTVVEPGGGAARIAIPADIQSLKREDLATAAAWRPNVRAAFEAAFEAGLEAVDLDRSGPVAYYVLVGFSL